MPPTTRILFIAGKCAQDRSSAFNLVDIEHDIAPDRIAERIAALPLDRINRRLESSDQRRQMTWQGRPVLQRLDGGVYRAARFVPKYHDQRRLKHLHSVSQAGHHFVAGEIAGDAASELWVAPMQSPQLANLCPFHRTIVPAKRCHRVTQADRSIGRYERRHAALSVSDRRREDRGYFRALHRQIKEGGAEGMMWDLLRMDLEGWHPREIPTSLLKGAALQRQQAYTLPPLEQWYFGLQKDGRVPGALVNNNPLSKRISRPNTAYTKSLTADARERFPRLRWELSDSMLEDFVTDEGWPREQTQMKCGGCGSDRRT